MNIETIRATCRVIRVVVGLATVSYGTMLAVNAPADSDINYLWFLGAIPLIAGFINFCPLCIITKKCDLPENTPEA